MNRKLIRNDILLIISILTLIVALALFIYNPSEGNNIIVMYDNKVICTLSLDKDTIYTVDNTGVKVCIKDGKAFILESDCPDKLCVGSEPIHKRSTEHASIVCLPNKVSVVRSNGTNNKEADVIAG